MPAAEPTGIGPDRALVETLADGRAVLLVGPGRTPLHLGADELPDDAVEGTWVVLDTQCVPPLVLSVDRELTDAGPSTAT
ncbi:hypothetical protein [Egicoccus halophilus]|uniref:Uncharacterized protein n=1 Tax=Egicoccus halophilus TaxID=1670830 RepID=A0A8J3ACH8_9ACTN|nr:hypothetical protein [Egicoccus halophilus]GGI03679.1 hypothetical protein GCM10011354_05240 [Egicoccus halophilus]